MSDETKTQAGPTVANDKQQTPKPCIHCGGSGRLYDRRYGQKHTWACNFCLGTGWDGVHPPVMVREALRQEGFREDLMDAWLSAVNELLGGVTPLAALDEDRAQEVITVARAFAAGRVPGPPSPPRVPWHRPIA